MNRTKLINCFLSGRQKKIFQQYASRAEEIQAKVLQHLIRRGTHTEWGKMHGFNKVKDYADFAASSPLNTYEELKGYIDRMRHGEKDILWPGQVRWYAKSSGTTNDKSKFIPVSREFLRDYPLEDIIFYTDFHWTPVAAREAAEQVGAWLNENGVPADESVLAADAYEKIVEEDIFFGRLGQRIGVKNIAPEDFTLLIPEFSSYIKVTHREGEEEEVHEGPFSEAVMRTEDAMRRNEEGYSTNCYYAYGPHAWESEYENDSAPQSRVLVMKDSFGTPVAAFLSNAVGELLATDQRKTTLSAEEYVEQYQPDAVVVVYCQDMLREKNYAFMDE